MYVISKTIVIIIVFIHNVQDSTQNYWHQKEQEILQEKLDVELRAKSEAFTALIKLIALNAKIF